MRATMLWVLVPLVIIAGFVDGARATAEEDPSDDVAAGTIAFKAGKATPSIEHPFLEIRSVETTIAKPNLQTGKQKIGIKMTVNNSGEKNNVIITVALLGGDENILDAAAVKGKIDDAETFKVKFNMLRQHVKLIQSIRFEVSSLND